MLEPDSNRLTYRRSEPLHHLKRAGCYAYDVRVVCITMNHLLKRSTIGVGIFVTVVVVAVILKANLFLLPFAIIAENGRAESGYVYANSYRPKRIDHLVITKFENGQRRSYFLWIGDGRGGPAVSDCEEWTAPHLPLFMFPDVNPPCTKWYAAEEIPTLQKTSERDVKVKQRSVEFTANDGGRVTVSW